MTRNEWAEFEKIRNDPKVVFAMSARCEEQGHEFENCCSITLAIYQRCKWCGERK